jgi:hypothetical protein
VSLERIGHELRRELDRLGPGGAITEIVAGWPDAVGPAIAANAWPARIARDGTLHVSTSSSTWAFELTHLESTLRRRLEERLGQLAPPRLRFAPGRVPESGETAEPVRGSSPPPSPKAVAIGREIAAEIENTSLREAVERAAAASLAATDARSDDRRF